jgi:zinc protease
MRRILVALTLLLAAVPAIAMPRIQELTTPSGLTVWLVQSRAVPMVTVETTFWAGSAYDPAKKEGLALLTAQLLNESAGSRDAKAYSEALQRLGATVKSQARLVTTTVRLQTLSENVDEAFDLYADAILRPAFADTDVARVRDGQLASIKADREDPGEQAERALGEQLFGTHPYGHPTNGYPRSVARLTAADAKAFHEQFFVRKNMVVSVVGDISAERLTDLLEKHFGAMDRGVRAAEIPALPTFKKSLRRLERDIPQSHVILALRGVSRRDPDYFPAFFMNHVLGGGGFTSRLMTEVREKRGLAYSVHSQLRPLATGGVWTAEVQTKNESVDHTIALMLAEMQKMRDGGITEAEHQEAMDYLVGSFPLRLDTSADILNHLTMMQVEGVGRDYLDTWVARMKAVTRADVQRVAKRLLDPTRVTTVVVGKLAEQTNDEPGPVNEKHGGRAHDTVGQ